MRHSTVIHTSHEYSSDKHKLWICWMKTAQTAYHLGDVKSIWYYPQWVFRGVWREGVSSMLIRCVCEGYWSRTQSNLSNAVNQRHAWISNKDKHFYEWETYSCSVFQQGGWIHLINKGRWQHTPTKLHNKFYGKQTSHPQEHILQQNKLQGKSPSFWLCSLTKYLLSETQKH